MDIHHLSAFTIVAVFFAMLFGVIEISYFIGRRYSGEKADAPSGLFLSVEGAILGLLALLLAFSFSIAAERYEKHNQWLVKDSNAIGTVWLRTDLLGPEHQGAMRDLLRQYVDSRLNHLNYATDDSAAAERTSTLQTEIWKRAMAARNEINPQMAAIFITAVNEMFDIAGEQTAGNRTHVPGTILWMLLITALSSGAVVGYAFGKARERNLIVTIVFAVIISAVLYALFDLDRPRRGLIQISRQSMLDLKASMKQ